MQKFIAEESFWELFPEAAIGVVVATGIEAHRGSEHAI